VVFLLLLLLVLVVDDEDVKSRSLGGCGCGVLFFLSSFLSFYYKHKTKGTAFWRLTEDFLLSSLFSLLLLLLLLLLLVLFVVGEVSPFFTLQKQQKTHQDV